MVLDGSDKKFYVYGKIPDNIKIGEQINFNYVENQVGQYLYRNVQEIHPEGFKPEEQKFSQETKEKVFIVDKFKDIKIVRQNTLRTSVMAFELLWKVDPEVVARIFGEAGGMKNAIKDLSRNFTEEVFRDESQDTKP